MAMPTEKQMEIIRRNTETLQRLSDTQLIMTALSELIVEAESIPVGKRVPLHAALNDRAGVKF